MNRSLFSAMIVGALGLMISLSTLAHAYPGQKEYGKEATISLQQAEKVALKTFPGKIVSEELEKEKGGSGLRYSFDVGDGKAVHEIGIDAKTGAVLENSTEIEAVKPKSSASIKQPTAKIALPGGKQGIGFDDMGYFPQLRRVVVPAAQTGDLDLINPKTYAATVISDVAAKHAAPNGDDPGSTSVAYGDGYLFAGDHGNHSVAIVNPRSKRVVGHVKLAADYDFVRYLASRHELWVTEPGKHRIEIFEQVKKTPPTFRHKAFIAVPDGPEALVFDSATDRAYTDERSGSTVAISLSKRAIVARWPNSCQQSRGLARDGQLLFVACREGAVAVLDTAHNGKRVGKIKTGTGVDLIAYDSAHHRLFVPGAKSATLTVMHVSPDGHLRRTAVYRTVKGAHCVAAANDGKAFVCDPKHGRLLVIAPHGGA
ncbi:MAG: PepSY domain-containing protein [Gammaproteobacteria bacterium]